MAATQDPVSQYFLHSHQFRARTYQTAKYLCPQGNLKKMPNLSCRVTNVSKPSHDSLPPQTYEQGQAQETVKREVGR